MVLRGDEVRGRRLGWFAFLGVLLTLAATFLVWPLSDAGGLPVAFAVDLGFGGDAVPMLVLDRLALFFKLITVLVLAILMPGMRRRGLWESILPPVRAV